MRITTPIKIVSFLIILAVISVSTVNSKERLYIKVGELRSIFTDSPHRISISDPAIADVTSVTKSEILVIGKSPGNTIINIWDKWGKQKMDVDVYLENLSSLEKRVERLLKTAGIVDVILEINADENKIVVRGDVQEQQKEQFNLLTDPFSEKLINLVKFKETRKSVLIDVNILELDKTAVDQLGIEWPSSFKITEEGAAVDTATSLDEIFKIGDWTRTALSAKLNLLVQNGKGKILSRPKLVCLSGKEAEFLVGGEIPVVTTTVAEEGTSTNVEYKEYGIILRIKPVIEGVDGIRTSLTTEVSEIDTSHAVIASGINISALSTRSTSTEVFIREGQTIFLAGLLKNKDSRTISRVPGLGDIPVLGHLFRSRNFSNEQTELVITLTPTIIDNDSPGKFVSVKKEKEEISEEKTSKEKRDEERQDLGLISQPTKEERHKLLEILRDPINVYARSLQETISEQFFYPAEAKDENQSGTVVLSLHILSDGAISDISLSRSSGFKSLDKSAITLVQNITGLEPFPDVLPLEDLWIDIPIEYHLD